MKLKRTLAGLLAFGMLFSVTGCSSSDAETRIEDDDEDDEKEDRSDRSTDEEESSRPGLMDIFDIFNGGDTGSSSADWGDSSASSSMAESDPWGDYSDPNASSAYSEPDTSSSYSEPDTSAGYNDSGDTLTILSWASNSDTQRMVDFFLGYKGYDSSKVTIVSVGDNGEAARDNYKDYLNGFKDADLIICDYDWVADYIYNYDYTMPLSEIGLYASDFSDAYEYTLARGTNGYGDLMAVTPQITTGGFVYRADLAEEYLGVTSPAEMQQLVGDWDSFRRTGEIVYEASGGRTALQATEGGMWQAYQCSRNQPWVVDGRLNMDNAEYFMELAMDMRYSGSLAGVPMWDAAWYASVMNGSAMGEFLPTWGISDSYYSILWSFADEGEAHNLAICEGPCGWYWGGSYIAVARNCDNASLAREFIEFYCSDYDSMMNYCLTYGEYVNNREVLEGIYVTNPLLNDQDESIIIRNNADRTYPTASSRYDTIIKAKFNDAVNGYLSGRFATREDAIDFFKREVATSYPEITIE